MRQQRRLPIGVLAITLIAAGACAQGGDGGGGTGRGDGGSGGMDGSYRTDGGGGGTDGGASCTDEGNGSACESPTDLGAVDPGAMATSMVSYLPSTGDEDWFLVGFPSLGMPNMKGGGTPTIELARNDGMQFRFEVRPTCTAPMGCGAGMAARDLTSWSFTDDQSEMEADMSGDMDYSTRDVDWPSPVYVRVYRAVGGGDCSAFQLQITR